MTNLFDEVAYVVGGAQLELRREQNDVLPAYRYTRLGMRSRGRSVIRFATSSSSLAQAKIVNEVRHRFAQRDAAHDPIVWSRLRLDEPFDVNVDLAVLATATRPPRST